jgi:serine/threonine protein kinase
MSPEQLFGSSKTLTPASDVYSLALVAYEMLTGCRVFAPTSAVHLHKLHEEGVRVLPKSLRDEIPAAAQSVLLKALEFEPEKRYQQASEFGDALAQVLNNEETLPQRQGNIAAGIPPYQEAAFTPAYAPPASFPVNKPQPARSSKLAVVAVVALVLLTGIAALVWSALKREDNPAERDASATAASVQPLEREFAYSLMVTPMKDGKPLQKSFAAAPTQTFLSGWQFTLLFNSQQDGFLYLLNEGLDEKGTKLLRILFPHPENNAALSAAVKANQQIETRPAAFDSNPGTEKLWVVLSSRKVPELERVKHLVNSKDVGAIHDTEQSRAIQDFLRQHNDPKPTADLNKATNSVTVKARNEVLIELIELYHN